MHKRLRKTLQYLFVCYSDITGTVSPSISTTLSTSTVNCSPRWIVYNNVNSYQGHWNSATTQQQCLDACVANLSCVSVSWFWRYDPPSCWMYARYQRYQYDNCTLFEIVRQCNPDTGRLRDARKFLLQNYVVRSVIIDFTSARSA